MGALHRWITAVTLSLILARSGAVLGHAADMQASMDSGLSCPASCLYYRLMFLNYYHFPAEINSRLTSSC
jgi:hypothetical protein